MLYEVMRHCRNFFPVDHREDTFEIKDGMISLPFVLEGQYFLIEGSVFNDGLYKNPAKDLIDEEFNGVITMLAIPKEFLALVDEIEAYCTKTPESPYQSESFGGYSYTKALVNGHIASWKDVFAARLADWRKV